MKKSSERFIWLFGENLGETMDNNSWYSYVEAVSNDEYSDMGCYFVLKKTSKNVRNLAKMDARVQKNVVWRNSRKHDWLYRNADMFFVSLSYRDILPDKYGVKNKYPKPLVYLQHGVTCMKKPGYRPDSYNNSLYQFVCYGPQEKSVMSESNGFRDYQLPEVEAMPRWKGLVLSRDAHSPEQILWFLTWREYLDGSEGHVDNLVDEVCSVVQDKRVVRYLRRNKLTLKLCLHQFFDNPIAMQKLKAIASDVIHVVFQKDVELIDEIAKSKLLITDYSSIGFDATVIGVPVMMFQPDRFLYATKRDLLVDIYNDFGDSATEEAEGLINWMIDDSKHQVNHFLAERLFRLDVDKVRDGYYTHKLLQIMAHRIRNKVTFIGYNFFGRGGTVSATMAMAEGLMERGYLVDLISLKKIKKRTTPPAGVLVKSFQHAMNSFRGKVKKIVWQNDKNFYWLQYDANKDYLYPYVGYALKKYLATTNSATIISTRETLHPFVQEVNNEMIVNKILCFHTPSPVVINQFSGIEKEIIKHPIDNAVFVTENSRKECAEMLGIKEYGKYVVTGNSLTSNGMLELKQINQSLDDTGCGSQFNSDNTINLITLMRVSEDRRVDVGRLLEFAEYLKNNHINDIKINVFGGGNMVDDFMLDVNKRKLGKYINYRGITTTPEVEIRKHDALVDFSVNHSFGMIYIEAILNGKIAFAARNAGSTDVLRGIDNSIYDNWSQLLDYIQNLDTISANQVVSNYNKIIKRYGRDSIADRLSSLIRQREK